VIGSVDRGRRKLISCEKPVTTFRPQNAVIMVTGFSWEIFVGTSPAPAPHRRGSAFAAGSHGKA